MNDTNTPTILGKLKLLPLDKLLILIYNVLDKKNYANEILEGKYSKQLSIKAQALAIHKILSIQPIQPPSLSHKHRRHNLDK